MTPRQMKEAFIKAADSSNAAQALELVKEFKKSGWWVWEGSAGKLDGTEIITEAKYEGHCQICDQWFPAGTVIRWRGGSCSHADCWDKKFGV